MYLFQPFSKCQRYSITTQFLEYDICDYDLRVRFDKEGKPVVCHGLVEYDVDIMVELDHLASLAEMRQKKVSIRIMLEDTFRCPDKMHQRILFTEWCKNLNHYNKVYNFDLYGGWTKSGWREDTLYNFSNEIAVVEQHASVCWKGVGKILPRLYAYLNNADNVRSKEYYSFVFMCDFIEYCR